MNGANKKSSRCLRNSGNSKDSTSARSCMAMNEMRKRDDVCAVLLRMQASDRWGLNGGLKDVAPLALFTGIGAAFMSRAYIFIYVINKNRTNSCVARGETRSSLEYRCSRRVTESDE